MGKYDFFSDNIDDRDRYKRTRPSNYNMITRHNKIPYIYEGEDNDDPEDKPQWCPHCLKFEMKNRLGAKIVPYREEPQPDHDLWQSCYICGKTFPKYEAKYEQAIEGFAEPTDDPFDNQKGQVTGVPKRNSPAGKKLTAKRRKERDRPHHKDPEIDELLRIYGEENVKIHYDSNP